MFFFSTNYLIQFVNTENLELKFSTNYNFIFTHYFIKKLFKIAIISSYLFSSFYDIIFYFNLFSNYFVF